MMSYQGMTIAIPREIMPGERRVAAAPDTVAKFIEGGARVLIESEAGEGAFFHDEDFIAAGAEIIKDSQELYRQADILLKVKEPRFNNQLNLHEVDMLPENAYLVCFLHPAHPNNHETVNLLAKRNITSFTLDGIPRISAAQQMDPLTSMSTAAGYKAVISAANHLLRFIPMMPTALGVIQPAQFLVVGVGVAGLQSIATAKRLGAKVKALDIRPEANEQAKSLGAELIQFDIPADLAVGEGGYARRLPAEWYAKEREVLLQHLKECDAVILTALVPGEQAPILVDEEGIRTMKKGSVVVDISVDQGGNCKITRCGEEYSFEGITISGLANIPASLAIDSTWMFAQNARHFLNHLVKEGQVNIDPADQIVNSTLVTRGGKVVHHGTLLAMGLVND
jgi:H+-translocating NAD(P) transhydrogenase subunit alpha